MALYAYPDNFTEPVGLVVKYLLKQADVDYKELGHAAWQIVGYALSQFDKHPPLVGDLAALSASVLGSDADMANILQQATMSQGDTEAVPWALIISIAMEILKRFLNK